METTVGVRTDETPAKELHAAVRKAVDLCPTCAISLSSEAPGSPP
jgi:ferredoxin